MAGHRLVVVGSANLDIVVPVDHPPIRGETVLGGDHRLVPGGKGANQAVAASRLGAEVAFVGCVGADSAGDTLRAALEAEGVDLAGLGTNPDRPSGIALISVDADGDNAIVVSPGANGSLGAADIARNEAAIAGADATLLQLEIPLDTVAVAAASARGLVVLDPAPAPESMLPDGLLAHVDVLVPNETELARLGGRSDVTSELEEVVEIARALPVETVVVTLGSEGAVAVTDELVEHVAAPVVAPVDTTAAGDAFRAALALELVSGADLAAACRFANRVGAAATQRVGAQPSLPTRPEVDLLLGDR